MKSMGLGDTCLWKLASENEISFMCSWEGGGLLGGEGRRSSSMFKFLLSVQLNKSLFLSVPQFPSLK